jgi:hypothetical protein
MLPIIFHVNRVQLPPVLGGLKDSTFQMQPTFNGQRTGPKRVDRRNLSTSASALGAGARTDVTALFHPTPDLVGRGQDPRSPIGFLIGFLLDATNSRLHHYISVAETTRTCQHSNLSTLLLQPYDRSLT